MFDSMPQVSATVPRERSRSALLMAWACVAVVFAHTFAGERPPVFPYPGDGLPPPAQRGLDQVEAMPQREAACPVCGYGVVIPLPDALMRRRPGSDEPPPWRMDAARRDDDMCPYPAQGKVAFQADIVICPSCGYANDGQGWEEPLTAEARSWVLANLQPLLREGEIRLLGVRGRDMAERDMIEFFNNQAEIPDTIRLEHFRTFLQATHAPAAARARASILGAWAARREVVRPPRAAVLTRDGAAFAAMLETRRREGEGTVDSDIPFLESHLKKMRRRAENLPGADDMALRIVLAGLLDRAGRLDEAEKILFELYGECRERFLRPDQDPLWTETTTRASRTHRLDELENFRADAEAEVLMRMELLRRERLLLDIAASCIREAMGEGAFDRDAGQALGCAYLTAELFRRSGNLPLASEWFKTLLLLAPPDSLLARAGEDGLRRVTEDAGEEVNLLSAMGQDEALFERLRKVCGGRGR